MSRPLGSIVEALGGELVGASDTLINRLAPLATAGADALAFVANPRYASQIDSTQAACLIVPPALRAAASERGACIVTDDPYLYFARLTQWWRREHALAVPAAVHSTASVHPTAELAQGVLSSALGVISIVLFVVVVPVVAMALSTLFEGYVWTTLAEGGALLATAGSHAACKINSACSHAVS